MADHTRRRSLVRLAIVGGGVLIAANLFVLAGLGGNDANGPALPAQIQQLFPNPHEVIRPQETVGADLRDDLQGELYINGAPIPRDQLSGDPSLGTVTFRPGCTTTATAEGSECAYREFDPGPLNLRVDYWPRTKAREDADVGSYGWQIKIG
jgi:hypothetical protein